MVKKIGYCLFAFLLLGLFAFRGGSKTCKDLRTGKFYYYTKTGHIRVNMGRTATTQVEVPEGAFSEIKNIIVWKDSCSYDTYWYDESVPGKIDPADKPITVSIIYIGKDYYVATSEMKSFAAFPRSRDTVYFDQ